MCRFFARRTRTAAGGHRLPRWQEEHRQRVADTIRYRHYRVSTGLHG